MAYHFLFFLRQNRQDFSKVARAGHGDRKGRHYHTDDACSLLFVRDMATARVATTILTTPAPCCSCIVVATLAVAMLSRASAHAFFSTLEKSAKTAFFLDFSAFSVYYI